MNRKSTHQLPRGLVLACLFQAALMPMALAQVQPPVADNNQDEVISLDRQVSADTDSFRILRSGDKLELNRYVTRVYPLDHANPFEIFPYIKTIVDLEKGSVITARNPGPDGRVRAWLQVNVPEFQLPFIDQAIAAYDVPDFISAPGFVAFAYRTQHRSAAEVEAFITRSTRTGEGKMTSDAATNTIYFQESPSDFKRVFGSILFADIPVPQVDLELQLIELTEIDNTSMGLYWDAWKNALGGKLTFEFSDKRVNPAVGSVQESSSQEFRGLTSLGATTLADFLNYLSDEGAATILAETTITVGSGQEGLLDSTIDVPEIAYVYNKDQDLSLLTEKKDDFEGIRVRLIPTVAMQSSAIAINVEVRSPVGIGKTGLPIYSSQEYRSEFTLNQDQLYKVGGLDRSVLATQTRGIPGLKSIPYLRRLFSNEVNLIRKSSLYLFVRPRWSAPFLPDASWKDFHKLVEAFTIDDILMNNPGLQMSAADAALIRQHFEGGDQ